MQKDWPPSIHVDSFGEESSKLTVAVRVRPLLSSEARYSSDTTITVVDNHSVIIRDDQDFLETDSPNRRHRRSKHTARMFTYDWVFGPHAPQETVFERTALPLIESVLQGVNACVFASGATGSGKTYTMLGENDMPGIMTLALDELFHQIGGKQNVLVRCSFVEIYNEIVKDLLIDFSDSYPTGTLEIREETATGLTYIQGVTQVSGIRTIDEMMRLLHRGNRRRATEPTAANETSSRSHAVLQVLVEQKFDDGELLVSKLSLVDLAGSERAKDTQNRGIRFIEGGNINKSLLALGNCIKALASRDPNAFIPYRDSKLTRLLKDSLGGNCRTVMIANVSPFTYNFTDSLNTLNFANRAKNIKVKIKRNSFFENSEMEIQKYVGIIRQLEGVVEGLQRQLAERPHTVSENKSEEYIMYTDDDEEDSDDSPRDEEWMIKNQLMETISDQLRIRSQLARIDASLVHDPSNGSLELEREELISSLKLVSDKSDLLHQSMSNLHKRRRSVTPSEIGVSVKAKATIDDCCNIARKLAGESSLIRNRSLRSLATPSPDEVSLEEKLDKLKQDLQRIEERQQSLVHFPATSPSPPAKPQVFSLGHAIPQVFGSRPTGMTRHLSAREPLKAFNDRPKIALQSLTSPISTSSARSRSSGPIQFN
jgi:kinesin family protein 18/19